MPSSAQFSVLTPLQDDMLRGRVLCLLQFDSLVTGVKCGSEADWTIRDGASYIKRFRLPEQSLILHPECLNESSQQGFTASGRVDSSLGVQVTYHTYLDSQCG